jgi:hypothetical protein
MEKLVELLTWQNFFTGAGFVFGIITLIAYFDQKSTNKKQSEILDFVKNENNKKAILELEKTKIKLENEINEKIPGLGRRAILEEQKEFYEKVLADNYKELNEIQKLLEFESSSKENLSSTIKNYILSELYPKYLSNELKHKSRDRVLIFIGLIVLSDALTPFEVGYYLKILFGIYLFYEIIKLLILKDNSKNSQDRIFKNTLFTLRITFLITSIFCVFILAREYEKMLKEIDDFHYIMLIYSIISLSILSLSSYLVKKLKQSILKDLKGST